MLITIPVLVDFDSSQQIGTLQIEDTKMPLQPNWHLAIGYKVVQFENGGVTKYALQVVSVLDDAKFSSRS
jgi:hypothetical protein